MDAPLIKIRYIQLIKRVTTSRIWRDIIKSSSLTKQTNKNYSIVILNHKQFYLKLKLNSLTKYKNKITIIQS